MNKVLDFNNVDLSNPLEPYIEIDGGYATCFRCRKEVFPNECECSNCKQVIDWSWLKNDK